MMLYCNNVSWQKYSYAGIIIRKFMENLKKTFVFLMTQLNEKIILIYFAIYVS